MANFSDNAKTILEARYLLKDKKGNIIETPDEMLARVAKCVSGAEKEKDREKWNKEFMSILDTLEFLPNSPTLMNAGTDMGQLSACLSGDTVIRTCAGDFTIKELTEKYKPGEEFDVYCATSFSSLGVGKASNPRLTRKNAPIYKVSFDDGSFVKATDDHLFMLRNGEYLPLKELKVGQSMMPFNYDYNNGYLIVFAGIDKYAIAAHKFVYEKLSGEKLKTNEVIHHKDYCKTNNSFLNFEKMDKKEHFKWHSEHLKKFNPMYNPEVAKKVGKKMIGNKRGVGFGRPATRENVYSNCIICGSEIVDKKPRMCCSLKCQYSFRSIQGVRSRIGKSSWNKGLEKELQPFFSKRHTQEWKDKVLPILHSKEVYARRKGKKESTLHNHKVLSIEFAGNEDVYDLSVKKYHNFVANNAFVHNCFLIPVEDNLSAIMEAVKQTALIHKSGGGTGIVFSHIRPSGSIVNTTTGVASGPVSFMKIFDATTGVIKQGGKRRGANIGILSCNHPEILDFVKCKEDTTQFTNFNISVSITDNFMKAVKADNGYPLINPFTKEKTYIKANDIFHAICEQAWKTGEPGIIFIDTINKTNPVPEFGRIEGTNPCGEQPLLFWESCNLGSINLAKMVKGGKVDWNRLGTVTEIATRFLDDVIDVNKFPNVKISRKTKLTRKIGLGVMGWADMLIDLGIRYDSDEALSLAKRVMRAISEDSYRISKEIGKEKGYCLDRLKRRNSVTTTIAPTGCQIKENKIKTENGNESILEILEENNISWEETEKIGEKKWFDIKPKSVETGIKSEFADKIYYNGMEKVKKVTFEDGKSYEFTLNHPLLVARGGRNVWVQVNDLVVGDDIVKF